MEQQAKIFWEYFPYKEKLTSILDMDNNKCENLDGDWAFLGTI